MKGTGIEHAWKTPFFWYFWGSLDYDMILQKWCFEPTYFPFIKSCKANSVKEPFVKHWVYLILYQICTCKLKCIWFGMPFSSSDLTCNFLNANKFPEKHEFSDFRNSGTVLSNSRTYQLKNWHWQCALY